MFAHCLIDCSFSYSVIVSEVCVCVCVVGLIAVLIETTFRWKKKKVMSPKSPRTKKHSQDLIPAPAECKAPAPDPWDTWPGLVGRP